MIVRQTPLVLAPVSIFFLLGTTHADEGFVGLFNGKDLGGFKTALAGGQDNAASNTFTVKNGMLRVSGSPPGYIYTEKIYKNYVLRFDWKFLRDGGAGAFVHINDDKHKHIYPKSIEVEGGAQKDAGGMFLLGVRGKFRFDKEAQKRAVKFDAWNTTEIISKDRQLIYKINGIQTSAGKSELAQGQIGFQSEGGEIVYKNILIKVLK